MLCLRQRRHGSLVVETSCCVMPVEQQQAANTLILYANAVEQQQLACK
jgi:hypothetical protein